MAENNKLQMPGAFGGLMRYDDEYSSRFMLSPKAIMIFIALIIAFVFVLKVFFPINLGAILPLFLNKRRFFKEIC